MMKKPYRQSLVAINAVIFLLIVAASAKSAEECSVMVPMMGTIWKTNEMVTVRWSGVKEDKIPSIMLGRKNEEGILVDVAKLATDVQAGPGKHSLKLPARIPPADRYVIMLKSAENTKCASNFFFIEQGSSTGPVDVQNPPVNNEPPSLVAPSTGVNPGVPVASSSSLDSATAISYTSSLTNPGSGHRSHTGHEAVRTGTATQEPSSAAETSVVSNILGLFLALVVVAQAVVV